MNCWRCGRSMDRIHDGPYNPSNFSGAYHQAYHCDACHIHWHKTTGTCTNVKAQPSVSVSGFDGRGKSVSCSYLSNGDCSEYERERNREGLYGFVCRCVHL